MGTKINTYLRGQASQYFVAGELCRRGLVAVVTLGNCPNTDILCSNLDGTWHVHVQVKTFIPGKGTCTIGSKAEINYGDDFLWVLAGIPLDGNDRGFVYYIIPSPILARETKRSYKKWLATPGQRGQKHNPNPMRNAYLPPGVSHAGWSIREYKDRWDLITKKLN